MSLHWVITPKMIDGKPSTKTQLCAKGYQEQPDFRMDSPTCSRVKWCSIDIRTAFLQATQIEKRLTLTKLGIYVSVSITWQMLPGIFISGFAMN